MFTSNLFIYFRTLSSQSPSVDYCYWSTKIHLLVCLFIYVIYCSTLVQQPIRKHFSTNNNTHRKMRIILFKGFIEFMINYLIWSYIYEIFPPITISFPERVALVGFAIAAAREGRRESYGGTHNLACFPTSRRRCNGTVHQTPPRTGFSPNDWGGIQALINATRWRRFYYLFLFF